MSGRVPRRHWPRLVRWALAAVVPWAAPVVAHADDEATPTRPFEAVVERVVHGDLVMAGNSNLVSAGGWTASPDAVADVDGDRSVLCVGRGESRPTCADNSSSAHLDVPTGSRVIAARLYVVSSLSTQTGQLKVRLDGPDAGFQYTSLAADATGVPWRYEASVPQGRGTLRQAVWDVTDYVRGAGAGSYTVADIVNERTGAYLPLASWAIVAAYELDPAADLGDLTSPDRARFSNRALAWHDGFVRPTPGGLRVAELAITPGAASFARSMHLAAGARRGVVDNVLFNGQPLGNSDTPGNGPPPPGTVIGADASCNSTTDVFNETICVLGTPVDSKLPGATGYLAASDGTTASSGSAVDLDVVRVPDRYLVAGSAAVEVSVIADDEPPVIGMVAVAADLGADG